MPTAASQERDLRKEQLLQWKRRQEETRRQRQQQQQEEKMQPVSPSQKRNSTTRSKEQILRQRRANMAPPTMKKAVVESSKLATSLSQDHQQQQIEFPPRIEAFENQEVEQHQHYRYQHQQEDDDGEKVDSERIQHQHFHEQLHLDVDRHLAQDEPMSEDTASRHSIGSTESEGESHQFGNIDLGSTDMEAEYFDQDGEPTPTTGTTQSVASDEEIGFPDERFRTMYFEKRNVEDHDNTNDQMSSGTDDGEATVPYQHQHHHHQHHERYIVEQDLTSRIDAAILAAQRDAIEGKELEDNQRMHEQGESDVVLEESVCVEEKIATEIEELSKEDIQYLSLGEGTDMQHFYGNNRDDFPSPSRPLPVRAATEHSDTKIHSPRRQQTPVSKSKHGYKKPLLGVIGLITIGAVYIWSVCTLYPSLPFAVALQSKFNQVVDYLQSNFTKIKMGAMNVVERWFLDNNESHWIILFLNDLWQRISQRVSSFYNAPWKDTLVSSGKWVYNVILHATALLQALLHKLINELSKIAANVYDGAVSALNYITKHIHHLWTTAVYPANLESEIDVIEATRARLLIPMEDNQMKMNVKVKELLLEQEAWVLEELKRMKKRRAAYTTVTESILVETRAVILESIHEAKLIATQHIEKYTEEIAQEFMKSIQTELAEYERVLNELEQEHVHQEVERLKETAAQVKSQLYTAEKDVQDKLKKEEERIMAAQKQGNDELSQTSETEKLLIEEEWRVVEEELRETADLVEQKMNAQRAQNVEAMELEEEQLKLGRVHAVEELALLAKLEELRLQNEREKAEQEVVEAAKREEQRLETERKQAEELAAKVEAEQKRLLAERMKVKEEQAEAIKWEQFRQEEDRKRTEQELARLEKLEEARVRLEAIKAEEERLREEAWMEEERLSTQRKEAEEKLAAAARLEMERVSVSHDQAGRMEEGRVVLKTEVGEERAREKISNQEDIHLTENKPRVELNYVYTKHVDVVSAPSTASKSISNVSNSTVLQMGLFSMGFVVLGLMTAYFLSGRYRRLLQRKPRRNAFSPQRKRWQRPAEISDTDAEEVEYLPRVGSTYGEPEPEARGYYYEESAASEDGSEEYLAEDQVYESDESVEATSYLSSAHEFGPVARHVSAAIESTQTSLYSSTSSRTTVDANNMTTVESSYSSLTVTEQTPPDNTSVRRSSRLREVATPRE